MDVKELLEDWHRRAWESQYAHYETAKYYSKLNTRFGIPVVILTTVVGTSIFATLEAEESLMLLKVCLGLVSVAAAVLAALQTFLRFAERAEKHRAAGASFGAIRREIHQVLALPETINNEEKLFLDNLRNRFDSLAVQSPEIPSGMWEKLHKEYEQEG